MGIVALGHTSKLCCVIFDLILNSAFVLCDVLQSGKGKGGAPTGGKSGGKSGGKGKGGKGKTGGKGGKNAPVSRSSRAGLQVRLVLMFRFLVSCCTALLPILVEVRGLLTVEIWLALCSIRRFCHANAHTFACFLSTLCWCCASP